MVSFQKWWVIKSGEFLTSQIIFAVILVWKFWKMKTISSKQLKCRQVLYWSFAWKLKSLFTTRDAFPKLSPSPKLNSISANESHLPQKISCSLSCVHFHFPLTLPVVYLQYLYSFQRNVSWISLYFSIADFFIHLVISLCTFIEAQILCNGFFSLLNFFGAVVELG